jgi:putative tricarboxylic transport membrane protein
MRTDRLGIRDPRDFWSGVIFGGAGLAAVLFGRELSMGTATKMGPGYFPTVLGMILTLIGLALVVRACLVRGESLAGFAVRPLLLVLGAAVVFGLTVRGAGLMVALIVLVVVSAAASRFVEWRSTAILAVGLAVFSAVVFVKVLGLPISVLGRWFGG